MSDMDWIVVWWRLRASSAEVRWRWHGAWLALVDEGEAERESERARVSEHGTFAPFSPPTGPTSQVDAGVLPPRGMLAH